MSFALLGAGIALHPSKPRQNPDHISRVTAQDRRKEAERWPKHRSSIHRSSGHHLQSGDVHQGGKMGARGSQEARQPQHQSLEVSGGASGPGVRSSSHSIQVLEERDPKDSCWRLNVDKTELNFCAADTSWVKSVLASSECRHPR